VRYQRDFGPVDVKAFGFYETAGKEDLTTLAYAQPSKGGNPATFRYDNLSFYEAGVAVTSKNLTLAATYIGGAVNGQLAMRPTGGVPTNAVVAGLTYASGPIILAAEIGVVDTQGDARLTHISQRREEEIAFGGSYKLAPGLQLVGEYTYTQRHQGGFDFNQNAPGTTRDVKGQGVVVSTVLTW
jgi:predicted porin